MWYVNADGMEGWVPSSILRMMTDDEFANSSGQSTPMDLLSSADHSELSEDGESHSTATGTYGDTVELASLSSVWEVVLFLEVKTELKGVLSFAGRLSLSLRSFNERFH